MKPHKHAAGSTKWRDVIGQARFLPDVEYRVKPAERIPHEVWVNCNGCAYDTLSAAKTCARYSSSEIVHYREVMDDENG